MAGEVVYSMSMEEKRDHNRHLVTEAALELFLERGVDSVTTRDVAEKSGLTERSVYRYFYSRSDLVLATTFLFWDRLRARVELLESDAEYQKMSGIEQVSFLFDFYSSMFIDNPNDVRFILGAEMTLARESVLVEMADRPPGRFEDDTPLANAIRTGLADGTVSSDADVRDLYYMYYDAVLGTMQRHVLEPISEEEKVELLRRMRHLCAMFISALRGII